MRKKHALSWVQRSLIKTIWAKNVLNANIQAYIGDDATKVVDQVGKIIYVTAGVCNELVDQGRLDPETVDIRILRGAGNALYEQAGMDTVTHRSQLIAGLNACTRLLEGASQDVIVKHAIDLEIKLMGRNLLWEDYKVELDGLKVRQIA